MEFLKELFAEPLSYDAFQKAVKEKGIKLADLSKGTYIDKDKFIKADEALKDANTTIETLNKEVEDLKKSGADAEEWKTKLETLQNEIKAKEEKAEADRIAKEKAENVESRFGAVVGEKKFSHEAIRADYLKKFGEALESKDFEGKSDSEIFHELTKDDGAAFEGVQTKVDLRGANPIGGKSEPTTLLGALQEQYGK